MEYSNNWQDNLALPDMTSQPIQNPRLFSCVGLRSTSLGLAEAGTLKPDFAAKNWWNPEISFRILVYVVVQFYPWLKFYFPLFLTHYHTLPYPKTKENKI